MGQCRRCGNKVGFFQMLCEKCQSDDRQRLEKTEDERKAEDLKSAQEREAKRNRSIDEARARILERLNNGEAVYLHDTVHMEVDSYISDRQLGQFSFNVVREMGFAGWDVVGIVPRTLGYELFNQYDNGGTVYAGGLGGNILGVYILLRKELKGTPTQQQISDLNELLLRHIT